MKSSDYFGSTVKTVHLERFEKRGHPRAENPLLPPNLARHPARNGNTTGFQSRKRASNDRGVTVCRSGSPSPGFRCPSGNELQWQPSVPFLTLTSPARTTATSAPRRWSRFVAGRCAGRAPRLHFERFRSNEASASLRGQAKREAGAPVRHGVIDSQAPSVPPRRSGCRRWRHS